MNTNYFIIAFNLMMGGLTGKLVFTIIMKTITSLLLAISRRLTDGKED